MQPIPRRATKPTQGLEAEAPGGQEAPLRIKALAAEQAVVRIAGAFRPPRLAARRIAPVDFGGRNRESGRTCPSASFPKPSSTASPPARWSSGRRAWSRNWSRTRSTPARTRIEIATDGGGRRLIRVTDDGAGMTRADLALAVERHATSKLAGDDLLADPHARLSRRGAALDRRRWRGSPSRRATPASRTPGRSTVDAGAKSEVKPAALVAKAPASRCATCSTPRRRG